MKTSQFTVKDFSGELNRFDFEPSFILFFGARNLLKENSLFKKYKEIYPNSIITGCSTSGEIAGVNVNDNSIIITGVLFEKTKLAYNETNVSSSADSRKAGKDLVSSFEKKSLKHVFVLSDGLNVNGTDLVGGIKDGLPDGVNVTGGLAGDGADFSETFVILNNGESKTKCISAIAFYGDDIQIGYGSLGGWDTFGVERLVSKSEGNVLYKIDNQPALELYKSFLGEKAKELPSSGLLFPLSLRTSPNEEPVVRTILAVDEENQSLTFAGDIPEGAYVKLMKANIDRLVDGAEGAAKVSVAPIISNNPQLAILISCVGRKLVLKQFVEEEVEAVQSVVGEETTLTGFYSYGELAPFKKDAKCSLHNQTMTITTFSE